MKHKRVSIVTQILVAVSVLLLAASAALGFVLTHQSKSAMSTLIQDRMLDISNTAAAMLDGDALGTLSAEDAGTEPYEAAMDALRVFQENIDLKYIYCIRDDGDGTFSFSVDPTVIDPAPFGTDVVCTEALIAASLGSPAVDSVPYQDAWGRFYSAYSPVFNSAGKVSGIVAVDFSAEWFDQQIAHFTRTILFITCLSLAVGLVIIFLLISRLSAGFRSMDKDLNELSGDVDTLSRELEVVSAGGFKLKLIQHAEEVHRKNARNSEDYAHDEIGHLRYRIRSIQTELQSYISFIHAQAYSDAMTGTKNKSSYLERVAELDKALSAGTADFDVAVIDINGMKETNDTYGHDVGDVILIAAADAMKEVFDAGSIYRIGGDEFVILTDRMPKEAFEEKLSRMEAKVAEFNAQRKEEEPHLYLSVGTAYPTEEDKEYKPIFQRADNDMYEDKAEYYHIHGDRRKHMGWDG